MYSKKLRRVVYVSEATRPPEGTTHEVAVSPTDFQFLKPKIARPIAQYPVPRMVVQPTRLLSHHGFTPPRIVPTPPVANASSSSSTSTPAMGSSSNPIFLGPRGDVELSPVASPASTLSVPPLSIANSSTTFTIIVSHNTQPPERPMPHHHHHYLPSTLQHQSSPLDPPAQAEPTPAAASDRPRKRRQRADDLVPAGCGLTRDDIVCLPIDDFNDKVAEKSEKEIVVLKDKRRKGKNRVRTLFHIV